MRMIRLSPRKPLERRSERRSVNSFDCGFERRSDFSGSINLFSNLLFICGDILVKSPISSLISSLIRQRQVPYTLFLNAPKPDN